MRSEQTRLWQPLARIGAAIALMGTLACKKKDDAPPAAAENAPAPAEAPPAPSPGAETAPPAPGEAAVAGAAAPLKAEAELKPASGSQVTGTVTFTEKDGAVELAIDVRGLPPGDHGFHIHEIGDCSAADAKSAGDHFNPEQHPHGAPDAPQRHAGDLGNLSAGAEGTVKDTRKTSSLTVSEGKLSVLNRAVVIHEKADDLKSQPSGNAGARIACGVVKPAS